MIPKPPPFKENWRFYLKWFGIGLIFWSVIVLLRQ